MPVVPRARTIALGLAALCAALALACTSDEPTVPSTDASPEGTSTPSGTPTAVPATRPPDVDDTPSPAAPPDHEASRALIDTVIEAVSTRDVDVLQPLLLSRNISCAGTTDTVPLPACATQSGSGRVDAFPAGVCVASWYTDPRPILERFVQRAGPLIAVTTHPEGFSYQGGPVSVGHSARQMPDGGFRVIFQAEVGDEMLGYAVVIDDGAISFLELGCRSQRDSVLASLSRPPEILVEGPAFLASLPEATPTEVLDPLATPRGTHTGLAGYDRIIDAIATREAAHILEVLHARRMQCTRFGDIGSPPVCDDDELDATVVDAFLTVGCEGAWSRADLPAAAAALAGRDIELYAIVGNELDEEFILFAYQSRDPEMVDTLLYVEDGSVLGYATLGCSTAEDFGNWYPVIFRGPAWPEDAPAAE